MNLPKGSITITFFVLALVGSAYSQNEGKLCGHLPNGAERKKCLDKIHLRNTRAAEERQKELDRLNLWHRNACNAAALMDATARAAQRVGMVTPAKPLYYAGKTWTSVRSIASALTREKKNCESARNAVEKARGR